MLWVRYIFCAILIVLPVSTASAQTILKYDPTHIPYAPKMNTFKECGIKIPVDPTWPLEKTRKPKNGGGTVTTFKHFLDGKYWKKDPRPFSEFTVNPSVLLNVTCEPSKLRQTKKNDYRESMARSIYDSAKSKPKTKVSKFHTLSSPGLDKVYYFYTATKGVGISDTLRLFAFNDGKLASIFFRINRTPSKNYSTRLSVGSIQTIHDKRSGQLERIRVKLTGPARKGILGGFAGIRTEKQNIAMFETVLKSLQGI